MTPPQTPLHHHAGLPDPQLGYLGASLFCLSPNKGPRYPPTRAGLRAQPQDLGPEAGGLVPLLPPSKSPSNLLRPLLVSSFLLLFLSRYKTDSDQLW